MAKENVKHPGTSIWLKHIGMQIIAGGSAGCVEVSIMHPMDLIKTRFQLQSNEMWCTNPKMQYTGIGDCMRKMYKAEGVGSFWKGIAAPLMVETPKRAWKFCTFENFKNALNYRGQDKQPSPLTYSLAGFLAGATEGIIVNPFEAIKVKAQSNTSHTSESPSTVAIARQIALEEGWYRGIISKGLTATMWRNGSFNMVYFGFYHSVKDYVPQFSDPTAEFCRKFVFGLIAGTIASCVNIPFDVAKSRIQGPQPQVASSAWTHEPIRKITYRQTVTSMIKIYKDEGFFALYKGLLPKVLRLGPGGAIMLLVYENVYEFLKKTYPD